MDIFHYRMLSLTNQKQIFQSAEVIQIRAGYWHRFDNSDSQALDLIQFDIDSFCYISGFFLNNFLVIKLCFYSFVDEI